MANVGIQGTITISTVRELGPEQELREAGCEP